MTEFDRITERAVCWVQWNECTSGIKYREESLYYETPKHTGESHCWCKYIP